MKRREFIALISGAAAAWPRAARAQQQPKTACIGVLATLPLPPVQRFFRKLQEYGYVEGRNLRLEPRFAGGDDDRYPALAAELVSIPVDIIVTWGTPAGLAAKQATTTIPIVMGAIADPVSVGIVSNLARPEGNITGFATLNADLEVKRLELLKDLLPQLARIGVLGNTANPFLEVALKNLRPAAKQLGVTIELVEVHNSDQIEGALVRLQRARPDAVLIPADNLLLTKRNEIAGALNKSKLPAVYAIREFAAAGGLIVHGANMGVLFERAASYVDRILKGARPADLPFEQPTFFRFAFNLTTAKSLDLNVPPALVALADDVIE